jgi:hypothetical protein
MRVGIQFPPAQLAAIHDRLGNFRPRLQQNLRNAEYHQLQINQQRATAYMYEMFKNPTGELEESWEPISVIVQSNRVAGTLSNSSPYAWRREEGFSNKTDRLGRYYRYDPGIHYMRFVMRAQRDPMIQAIKEAVSDTLAGQRTRA